MTGSQPDPGLVAQLLGRAAYGFTQMQPMLPTYLHLIVSALFPIYAGAHASLSRPSSAAKRGKKKRAARAPSADSDDEDEDDEEGEEEERLMEGLSPTDALLMPLFAGCALASLYFLLKWMKDPALLNKILNGYFAIFGVFSVSRLVTDLLDSGHSLIYPHRHALDGTLYHVNGVDEKAEPVAGLIKDKATMTSPLPGLLARVPLPARGRRILWADRAMPGNKWTLQFHLHRKLAARFKIGPHGMVGVVAGLATVAYFNLVDKPWYLTNLLGFGFSYGALQLMSPTTFATGSLILGALFFYDIYFVFYTPMMVTVAKSLDVPIKLMFPRPGPTDDPTAPPSHAMLGLGDVVLPGIMIGLALRFDLYLFYLRRQKRIAATVEGEEDTVEKPQYHSLAGRWSDHFWTHSFTGRPLWNTTTAAENKLEAHFTFPKVYFTASLIGYTLGLLATLGVMMVWNHAQPALLYLVPGVLSSIWLTALVRGELNLMWQYTEAVEDEEQNKKKAGGQSAPNDVPQNIPGKGEGDDKPEKTKRLASHRPEREVFSFSIESPWKSKQSHSAGNEFVSGKATHKSSRHSSEKHNWVPSTEATAKTEPAGKRVRLN
ncbi:signal peptide peptidase-domain-containing protein [Ampelomyces quisqualis]|uniref:Signal peptide peptidase-domain-containing protein n=1 Tax=Ampelomyces quisqualis TaxID=50730 RepID=A0A6A5QNW9_AMPQU|nr:signal peptide peptidase-domain-containing protein [Ampelomyces quisqualis]